MVRIPGACNRDSATVVLAHLPGGGMGRKRHDLHAAWCCSSCHDVIDGRVPFPATRDVVQKWHLEGVIRTQEALIAEGVL